MYKGLVDNVNIEYRIGECLEKVIRSNKMLATIGPREYFQYFLTKFYQQQSEIIFHLPPHTEQSTFTQEFVSMAFRKNFLIKRFLIKCQ